MVIRSEGQVYKVLNVESKAGAAKMGGVVKATLSNLHTSRLLENHFRPQERLEDLELERYNMEFLYSGEGSSTFMNPVTFEQVKIAGGMIGPAETFLQPLSLRVWNLPVVAAVTGITPRGQERY